MDRRRRKGKVSRTRTRRRDERQLFARRSSHNTMTRPPPPLPPPPHVRFRLQILIFVTLFTYTYGGGQNSSSNSRSRGGGVDSRRQLGEVYLSSSEGVWGQSQLVYQPTAHSSLQYRYKRSVVQLYNMVKCATGCNPLDFKGYGCFCGFLGSGYPVDRIDSCCMRHDQCYNQAKCPMFLEYFVSYYWTCYRRRKPYCVSAEHPCGRRLCECDRQLSECLAYQRCPRGRKAVCGHSPYRLFQNIIMQLV